MRSTLLAALVATLALTACARSAQQQPQANLEEANAVVENEALAQLAEQEGNNAASSNELLSEPKGPIDPRSVEAAGQVVQHYGALIERGHWLKAEKLWGDLNLARAFATDLGGRFGEVHLEIGNLRGAEGAAGSIYTSMPVVFYGKSRDGKALRKPATINLRRVNDVPGSTEADRRWHIDRIEWKQS